MKSKLATTILLAAAPLTVTSCSDADTQAFQQYCQRVHDDFRRWFCRNSDEIIEIVDFVDDASRRVNMIARITAGSFTLESVAFFIASEVFDATWEPELIQAAVEMYCYACGGTGPQPAEDSSD